MRTIKTLVECSGCQYYLGQSPNEPFCDHPKFGQPGFYDTPITSCFTPVKRRKQEAAEVPQPR